jgi:outer membrane protein TolC
VQYWIALYKALGGGWQNDSYAKQDKIETKAD